MAFYRHLEFPTDFQKYVLDKKQSAKAYYRYLLARVQKMFVYKNLPDTIPHEILDRYLFNNGIACICEAAGKLRVFYGNAGGPQDEYYRPTQFIIANPHIKIDGRDFQANVHIFGEKDSSDTCDGVLMRNDTEWQGLYPLLARYSFLLAENTLTLRTADVMLRILAFITAPSDKERAAAQEFITSLENGELKAIGESPFFDGIRMQTPAAHNGSYFTQFIEYQQYLKGSFFNEIGLQANYNMKREAIGKGESTLDEDSLMPLYENMLMCRREDIAKVNDMFGTDISVELSSAWLTNAIEQLHILKPFAASSVVQTTENSENPENPEESSSAGADASSGEDGASVGATVGATDGASNDTDVSDVSEEPVEQATEETNEESKINDVAQATAENEIYEELVEKPAEDFVPQMAPVDEGKEEDTDATETSSSEKPTTKD